MVLIPLKYLLGQILIVKFLGFVAQSNVIEGIFMACLTNKTEYRLIELFRG